MSLAIVNYGSGNVRAIANILDRLKLQYIVARTPDDITTASRIILPGVGAFDQTMSHLVESGMRDVLESKVREELTPFLGICVGMQLLAESSEEGELPGLGWIPGRVARFSSTWEATQGRLPHMGWNTVTPTRPDPLFDSLGPDPAFYFLHSYRFSCSNELDILATTQYNGEFPSAIRKGNIWGVQFHPEKSHGNGVRLIECFARG